MEYILNCLGDICPIPNILAYEKYKVIKKNDIIKIITDHSCSSENIIERFKTHNCEISIVEPMTGIWEISITKK